MCLFKKENKIINLKSERTNPTELSKIEINVNEIGAELKSLKVEGKEYIWCSDPKYWRRSAPFLFPIVGSLKNKETIIEGKKYPLAQHGFLRDQKFTLKEEKDNEIVFENDYSKETLTHYPFKYHAEVKYVINTENDSLDTIITIKNIDEKEMYFNIGCHPAFNCPINEGEKFEDYRIVFEKPETFNLPLVCDGGLLDFNTGVYNKENITEIKLDKEIFTIDTILIKDVKSKSIKLLNEDNKGIEFSYPEFSTLAIWTPYNDAKFICLEPWIGYNDLVDTNSEYKEKADLVYLKKDESFACKYTIKIIK